MNVPQRIRFDDAIIRSSDPKLKGKEVAKFFKYVNWTLNTNVVLTPAILCRAIGEFPDGIDTMRRMQMEGLIYCDLHGWDHEDYAARSQEEIESHLDQSMTWFDKHLNAIPVRWQSPHGAWSAEMQAAADKYGLILETTAPPVIDQKTLDTRLRQTWDLSVMSHNIIMCHWYEHGLRLYRIARIIENQSVPAAIEATRSELSKRDHKICWNEWNDPREMK